MLPASDCGALGRKLLLIAVVLYASPALSEHQLTNDLVGIGQWLGEAIRSLYNDDQFDKDTGRRLEQTLSRLETSLLSRLRNGDGDVERLRKELSVLRSELGMLKMILNQNPGRDTLDNFAVKLSSDLEKLRIEQQRQALTNEHQEGRLDQHDAVIEQLNQKIDELSARLEHLGPNQHVEPESTASRPTISSKTQGYPRGITLDVRASGSRNTIALDESPSTEEAHLGFYEVPGSGGDLIFYLAPGTGAVITLFGANNIIELQNQLCGRVRVVDRGVRNKVTGCR